MLPLGQRSDHWSEHRIDRMTILDCGGEKSSAALPKRSQGSNLLKIFPERIRRTKRRDQERYLERGWRGEERKAICIDFWFFGEMEKIWEWRGWEEEWRGMN